MLTRIVLIACVGLIAVTSASAEDSSTLRQLETELRQRFSDLRAIDYRFDNGGRTLVAEFKTRKFMVHGRSKVGVRSREAHEVVGPSHTGFLVRIHLQGAGTVNQAIVPQTIREPYWNTDLDVQGLNSREQVYIATSYGPGLDAKVRKRLANFWKQEKAKAVPEGGNAKELSILEGTLKQHPKFAYRYYLDGLSQGQTCGLMGMDAKLKDVRPGTRIRVRGILFGLHFEESAYNRPNAALVVADYIYMDVKHLELLSTHGKK